MSTTNYNVDGVVFLPQIVGINNDWAIVFGNDSTFKIVRQPYGGSSQLESLKFDSTGKAIIPAGTGTGTGSLGITVYRNSNTSTGIQTTGTAADKIADQYTLPANSLAVNGQYIYVTAVCTHAANVNSVTYKLFWGGTGAINATITGGTNIISSGANTTSGGLTMLEGYVYRQSAGHQVVTGQGVNGATAVTMVNTTATVDETTDTLINLTINNATAATDGTVNFWIVQYFA